MIPKYTTDLLTQLRALMKNTSYVPEPIDAYIVPQGDAHQGDFIAECDQRITFISGFTGTASTAIITDSTAALWAEGIYSLQVKQEMDSNWIFMNENIPDTPTEAKWLSQILNAGSVIGVDPYLVEAEWWQEISRKLQENGQSIIPIPGNLIDHLWKDQPDRPSNPVIPLQIKYTGKSVVEKLQELRCKIDEENTFMIILTALDDIAYLFNLRGSDIDCYPVFFSYAAITRHEAYLFMNLSQLTDMAMDSLKTEGANIKIQPYEDFSNFIKNKVASQSGKVLVSNHSSQAITQLVPKERRLVRMSPIATMKAIKNETEIAGFEACHLRDSVVLCRFLCWLEKEAVSGLQTEISAANYLQKLREEDETMLGLSFPTISAVGPNGSFMYYSPTKETDRRITGEKIYFCDSGAHYKDGTTDVTRTVHYGVPSKFERECFTRVLKGVINISTCIFPNATKGECLDTLARKALWDVGLNYGHGTGHGIGTCLSVLEGPTSIGWRSSADDHGLKEGMFFSIEPGYYEPGKFGVKVENVVRVVKAGPPHNHRDQSLLAFKTLNLVPIQTKLIDLALLTRMEIEWLNTYHMECRNIIGKILLKQGHQEVHNWLVKETHPIELRDAFSG